MRLPLFPYVRQDIKWRESSNKLYPLTIRVKGKGHLNGTL